MIPRYLLCNQQKADLCNPEICLWDFIGGKNTFHDLLNAFDEVGKDFKDKLNKKFKQIAKDKLDSY